MRQPVGSAENGDKPPYKRPRRTRPAPEPVGYFTGTLKAGSATVMRRTICDAREATVVHDARKKVTFGVVPLLDELDSSGGLDEG